MTEQMSNTWPYPTRLSEAADTWGEIDLDKRLELSEYQRETLQLLESALYADLKEIRKKKVEKEEVDPEEIAKRRMEILEGYWERKGDVAGWLPSERERRVIDETSLEEKIGEYRVLKLRLKELLREFEGENDFSLGAKYILEIYKRYVNVRIAEAVVEADWNPRSVERVDKFVNGVFSEKDERGDFLVLGEILRDRVKKIEELPSDEFRYPDVWLDQDDIEIVIKYLFKEVGLVDWKVTRRSGEKSVIVAMTNKKEIRLGRFIRRRLEDALPVIAHEVEGHALNTARRKTLKIMDKYSAGGRSQVSTEMSGRWIEDETRVKMGLNPKAPETLYFRMMELKKTGATFVECFDFCFRGRMEKIGYEKEVVFEDPEKYKEVFDYSYDRTMRIFRRRSSLAERSGHLTSSNQLKYLEQAIVLEKLIEVGLEKTMFIDGMDLYALRELAELGVLNDISDRGCGFLVAEKVWPVIKIGLDNGKIIKDILNEMKIR